MDAFLNNLRELFATLTGQTWGTVAANVSLAVAAIVLIFGAGTIARVIFGKDTGLVKTALATLLVIGAGLAGTAAALTWGHTDLPLAAGAGAAAALVFVWPASRVLRLPYGQTFGILVFAVAITGGAAYGTGRVCQSLAEGAGELKRKQSSTFQQAR